MNNKDMRQLKLIPPDQIKQNPENPRLIFRSEELEDLMASIDRLGVQVPINVYKDGSEYRLIDGERRWRCAKKLNLKTIPALIQDKPTDLENLLLMYNIHALREQWDYFTIASTLQRIIDLFQKERGKTPNEAELSEETGLSRGQIRRCQLLLELPDNFKKMLLSELELPKSQQKLSEDFFIEMERSLKTVTRRIPLYQDRKDEIRNVLVKKFKDGVIGAVTDFRHLSKIATAVDSLGVKKERAEKALNKVFDADKKIGIREAYHETVEFEYDEKKAVRQIEFLIEYFSLVLNDERKKSLDEEFIQRLKELRTYIQKLLKD